jgi:hypothetical protein
MAQAPPAMVATMAGGVEHDDQADGHAQRRVFQEADSAVLPRHHGQRQADTDDDRRGDRACGERRLSGQVGEQSGDCRAHRSSLG